MDIFKYINPNDNLLLTKLSNQSLMDFLYLVNHYLLEYRDSLSLPENLTFGLEIECDKFNLKRVRKVINQKNQELATTFNPWQITTDISVNKGGEIISPILQDNHSSWYQVQSICYSLQKYAKIKDQAAGHVHIGTNIIGDDVNKLWQFLQLWISYEKVIYRFCYNEYLTARPRLIHFACPIADLLNAHYETLAAMVQNNVPIEKLSQEIINILHRQPYNQVGRNEAINFNNVKDYHSHIKMNTIEFRCPNGTLNPIIWQNNVNLFAHLLSSDNLFQADLVNTRRLQNKHQNNNLESYQQIALTPALELCDLIFNQNIDKIYFLRQYLKNYEESTKTLKRAKPFTR